MLYFYTYNAHCTHCTYRYHHYYYFIIMNTIIVIIIIKLLIITVMITIVVISIMSVVDWGCETCGGLSGILSGNAKTRTKQC